MRDCATLAAGPLEKTVAMAPANPSFRLPPAQASAETGQAARAKDVAGSVLMPQHAGR